MFLLFLNQRMPKNSANVAKEQRCYKFLLILSNQIMPKNSANVATGEVLQVFAHS